MTRRIWLIAAAVALLLLIFGSSIARFYTDWLWFGELKYQSVFLTRLMTRLLLGLIAGALFFLIVFSNLWLARRLAPPTAEPYQSNRLRRRVGRIAQQGFSALLVLVTLGVSVLVGLEASSHWLGWQMFTHPVSFNQADPLFHRDAGFYVFRLGFLRYIYGWLFFALVVAGIGTALVHYLDRAVEFLAGMPSFAPHVKAHLSFLLALILLVKAWGYQLDRYDLVFSRLGVVFGAGYTDVHARLPALHILSVIAVIAALLALVNIYRRGFALPAAALVILIGASFILGVVYPGIVQQVYVKPNQIKQESRFINYDIVATRRAFSLDSIQVSPFPAADNLAPGALGRNSTTIRNIRVWDYRPLTQTYSQLQELWQFFNIRNVDVDRYMVNGELRQVMLAARELSPEAAQAGTNMWINQHLLYTHGYGAVMSPVNVATSEGLPQFFLQGIPPQSSAGIPLTRPEIYYGELTTDYSIVDTEQSEFNYPPANYSRYTGTGGVKIGSYLRKLLFAVRFSDTNLILPNPLTSSSRVMFRRQIQERVQTLFPFLMLDPDPYLVISEGRMFWIQDAYTVSSRYPYAKPYSIMNMNVNYMRNAVKVVIDAYNGTVDAYVADPRDPMIRSYSRVFPRVFKPISRMPEDLRRHIRYPELLFRVQAEALLTYHMDDPKLYLYKGDLWAIPNEIVGESKEPAEMEPYYVVMRLPNETEEQFLMMLPFTQLNKDNMIAWMAVKSDYDRDYGKLILYQFPREKLEYGPMQIESRINQDPAISQQLTLWDQLGSRVNRGNLLVIPIEQSLLYIKPIYLAARNSKIPELKRVIAAYGDRVAMEPTLDAALARVIGTAPPPAPSEATPAPPPGQAAPAPNIRQLVEQAQSAFQRAQELQRQGDWAGYGEQLRRLDEALGQLRRATGGQGG